MAKDSGVLERALRKDKAGKQDIDAVQAQCTTRASAILRALKHSNPKAAAMATDPNPHISGCCPRRSGKTYTAASLAAIVGEARPGSIVVIISLALKQLKRIYWQGGPSGMQVMDRKFKLGLEFNTTDLTWTHQNGSIGYLMGTDKPEQIEYLRGMEADLYIIDECKSFAPGVLEDLIENVIEPQRVTREGRLMLIGTPGSVMAGPFYEATCPDAVERPTEDNQDADGLPYLVAFGTKDPHGRPPDELWSFHSWTLEDNSAKPHQWAAALKRKRLKKWADDEPTWLREYLGKWAITPDGLVSRYLIERATGRVTWTPSYTDENSTGLPDDRGPWRLIAGLDLGFESDTALVIGAYSRTCKELRHVYDVSLPHLLPDDVGELIKDAEYRFGKLERIFVDHGNQGGSMILNMLIEKYGLPAEKSIKRDKYDGIELQNSGFARGEIKIIPGSKLEIQLSSLQWDLDSDSKKNLARNGKLQIDRACKKDLFDAFLYLYRGAQHHYATPQPLEETLKYGSPEWVANWEAEQLRKYRARPDDTPLTRALSGRVIVPHFLQPAFQKWKPPWEHGRSRHS